MDNFLRRAQVFFLGLFLFWLPFSPAVVESSVITVVALTLVRWFRIGRRDGFLRVLSQSSIGQRLMREPVYTLMGMFLAASFYSAATSPLWDESLHAWVSKTLEWFVIFFLFAEIFPRRPSWVVGVLAVSAMGVVADGFWQKAMGRDLFRHVPLSDGYRVSASFSQANGLGAYLAVMLGVFAPFAFSRGGHYSRGVFIVLMSGMVGLLFFTFSRGAWIAAGVGLSFVAGCFIQRHRGFLRKRIAIGVLSGVILTTALGGMSGLRLRFSEQEIHKVLGWRWQLWRDTLTMIQDRPLFGHGPNTFMAVFQAYREPVSRDAGIEWFPTYAHNSYLQIAAETGWVGCGLFGLILMALAKRMKDGLAVGKAEMDSLDLFRVGMGGGLLAFLTQAFVDNLFFSLPLMALFWSLAGLAFGAVSAREDPKM